MLLIGDAPSTEREITPLLAGCPDLKPLAVHTTEWRRHAVVCSCCGYKTRAKYDLSSLKWVAHTGAACPVDAFTPNGYDVAACGGHIATAAGADCMDLGCRARRACPIGRKHQYEADQARFHMAAFLSARQREATG